VERACLLGAVKFRRVKSDVEEAMRGEALKDAMKTDKDKGLIPFFVINCFHPNHDNGLQIESIYDSMSRKTMVILVI
jgi:S-methylmethionine-dependent homocysteine/selenocysteine methylase